MQAPQQEQAADSSKDAAYAPAQQVAGEAVADGLFELDGEDEAVHGGEGDEDKQPVERVELPAFGSHRFQERPEEAQFLGEEVVDEQGEGVEVAHQQQGQEQAAADDDGAVAGRRSEYAQVLQRHALTAVPQAEQGDAHGGADEEPGDDAVTHFQRHRGQEGSDGFVGAAPAGEERVEQQGEQDVDEGE